MNGCVAGGAEYELDGDQSKADRLAEERRRRRQAILAKYAVRGGEASSLEIDPPSGPARPASSKRENRLSSPPEAAPQEGFAAPSDLHTQRETSGQERTRERVVDDLDDMFSLEAAGAALQSASGTGLPVTKSHGATAGATEGHTDNFDDPEGYYRVTLGELLDEERYSVFANLGKGMFSTVVRARDTKESNKEVAIKIIRSQETMYKAGRKEMSILKRLAEADPEGRRHVVRMEHHFMHRNHLCMVFESLSMNLREVVKRFGKDVGLNIRAVKAYAHQMLLALSLMHKLNIMHADLKPDNILVNDAKTVLKVCDLGSASDLTEMEITPYLVSRFYRAPEIILGQSYDCAIDMWSVGCTLYELYTGKILFPGRSNNQMLLLMQELKGKFTAKQARRGKFGASHFDDTNAFLLNDVDKTTGQPIVKRIAISGPKQDLRARLIPPLTAKVPADEFRLLKQFVDLLERMLELDPSKRITPKEALGHPFLS